MSSWFVRFLIVAYLIGVELCLIILICIALLTDMIQHLFIYVVAIWVASFVNHPFISFANFSNAIGLFINDL